MASVLVGPMKRLYKDGKITKEDVAERVKTGKITKADYEYDGNIFRTYKTITEDDVRADLEYYLNYDGDEKPTDEMVEYANKAVDEYTLQLMEEGVI